MKKTERLMMCPVDPEPPKPPVKKTSIKPKKVKK